MTLRPSVLISVLLLTGATAHATDDAALTIRVGPVRGAATQVKSVSILGAERTRERRFDLQDGRDHIVRGVSLRELLVKVQAPKTIDAVIFHYTDGMQLPVHLDDQEEVDAVFIAMEHGDVRDNFTNVYPLNLKGDQLCPKVVYGRKVTTHSLWLFPTQLASIQLVTWKLHEAALAQPTRRVPDRSGWPIYLRECQPCHGIGAEGAARGPDFLSDLGAYRRVPPLATTDMSQPPSLHEKVKGYADGTMPALSHISNAEITTLWRWLHAIHRSATR
ncbi:MAG TPA: cytochrome c [Polyangia bacterium]|nr:cytochrome c [Polyangia bacterium]